MFLAKPNERNLSNSVQFEDMFQAQAFLEETTGIHMPMDEWIILGKILKIGVNGTMTMPEFYPKIRKGELLMERVDIESFL